MPDRAQRLRDEHARSHGYLKQYHAKNPSVLSDPENYLQAFGMCTDEQLKDLRAAGVPSFRESDRYRDPSGSS